jgi:hypothetical protein
MYLRSLLFGLLFLIFSCSKTKDKNMHTVNPSNRVDTQKISQINFNSTVAATTDSIDTSLSFGTVLVEQKQKCYSAFKSIKTSSDFLTAYHLLNQLEIDMNALFKEMEASMDCDKLSAASDSMMGNALPWISVAITAEGSLAVSDINNLELQKSALLSPETDDDGYVDLLLATFGMAGSCNDGFPVWITRDCDVCFISLLGDGSVLNAFKQAQSIKDASSQFAADAEKCIEVFFAHGSIESFKLSKDNIIAEIDEILNTINMTDAQKAFLEECRRGISDKSKNIALD